MLRSYSRSTFIWNARGLPNSSIITEWSMTRSTGFSGLILLRVAAQRLDPVAHGGQVHHGGDAGEILHQHAGGAIGDLARVLAAVRRPVAKARMSSSVTVRRPRTAACFPARPSGWRAGA
jgi:hypothetical protein